MTEILQICQRLNRLRALQHQGDAVLRLHPEHPQLITGLDSADRLTGRLERRLERICAKKWFDLFRYTFQPSNDRPVPAMELAQSICSFQQLVGVTLDSLRTGKPKERATVPQQIVDKDYFGFGYSYAGAVDGAVGFTLIADNEKMLLDSHLDQTFDTVLDLAASDDTEHIYNVSQRIGSAPIRVLGEWCNSSLQSDCSTEVAWWKDAKQKRAVQHTPESWRRLRETISMVSDTLTEPMEVTGVLVAANMKTKRFVIETGDMDISGRFDDAISARHVVKIPHRYKAELERFEKRNYATDTVSVTYKLKALHDL